ncbi:hypothetical protein BpHYR1_039956, partial [Brachionus plicatilis]
RIFLKFVFLNFATLLWCKEKIKKKLQYKNKIFHDFILNFLTKRAKFSNCRVNELLPFTTLA